MRSIKAIWAGTRRARFLNGLAAIIPALALPVLAVAGGAGLAPGARAPELDAVAWLDGIAPELGAGLRPRLLAIDFWATWNPVCRETLPLLAALANRHREEVVVVGISAESAEKVSAFAAAVLPESRHYLAVDPDGAAFAAFMPGERVVPTSFLIDATGRVLWRGHSLDLPNVIRAALNGTFDARRQRRVDELAGRMNESIRRGLDAAVAEHAEAILHLDPDHRHAWRARLFAFERANDLAGASAAVNELLGRSPRNADLYLAAVNLIGQGGLKAPMAMAELARKAKANLAAADPFAAAAVAAAMLDVPPPLIPLEMVFDLALAAASAETAESPSFRLETLARAYYAVGAHAAAAAVAEKAAKAATDEVEARSARQLADFCRSAAELRSRLVEIPAPAPKVEATGGLDILP